MGNSEYLDCRLSFKSECGFEKRCELNKKIKLAYPTHVAVIVERNAKSKTLPQIEKRKFLAPTDITFSQFLMSVRENIKTKSGDAIFWYINDKCIQSNSIFMDQIHAKYKDEDGFLYVSYMEENAFGQYFRL